MSKPVIGLIALVALLGIAAPASAGVIGTSGGFTYVSKMKPLGDTSGGATVAKRVRAKCPRGQRPVGGGTAVTGDAEGSYVSTTGPGRGRWSSAGWHFDTGPGRVVSYGICMRQKNRLKVESDTLPVPGNGSGESESGCGPNATAVGGGIRPSGPIEEWWLNTSFPKDSPLEPDELADAWSSKAYHRPLSPTADVSLDAVCMGGGAEPVYDVVGSAFSTTTEVTLSAKCPRRMSVVSGGPSTSGNVNEVHVSRSAPFDSGDPDRVPDDGWRVTFSNPGATEHDFVSYAVCL